MIKIIFLQFERIFTQKILFLPAMGGRILKNSKLPAIGGKFFIKKSSFYPNYKKNPPQVAGFLSK